jgi:hypothetical protein
MMLLQAQTLWIYLGARFVDPIDNGERGSAVETVIITALFAAMAIAVATIIVIKITSKANSIDLQ